MDPWQYSLLKVQYERRGTGIAKALEAAKAVAFRPENGGRGPGTKKIVYLITDGFEKQSDSMISISIHSY